MIDILNLIPEGHEHPVGRDYLARAYMEAYGIKYATADRRARHDIEIAVKNGCMIANVDGGYFRFKDESDIPYLESYCRRENSKGWAIINKNKGIQKFIKAFVKSGAKEADTTQYTQMDLSEFWGKQSGMG